MAGGVIVEDVGHEADGALGGINGGEHFVVSPTASGERGDGVAGEEREVSELGDVVDKLAEMGVVFAEHLAKLSFFGCVAAGGAVDLLLAGAEVAGFALDAI